MHFLNLGMKGLTAYFDERGLHYQFSLHNLSVSFIEGWENLLFELGSERVDLGSWLGLVLVVRPTGKGAVGNVWGLVR